MQSTFVFSNLSAPINRTNMASPILPMKAETAESQAAGSQLLGRRGSCSFFHNGKFYLYSGYTGRNQLFERAATADLEVFDLTTGNWSKVTTSGDQMPECISGSCCTVTNNRLYVFGGWFRGYRNASVYELDLTSMKWRQLPASNPREGPFLKDKAGMVAYGNHMVCVFGGYGYPSWHQVGGEVGQPGAAYNWDTDSFANICWTNELHLFHVERCEWISPETTGVRPPPCAAFTFTKVDCSRVVLFGGRQVEERVNHVHILDMSTWHWSGALFPSSPDEPWPSKRSFHTACALVDPDHISPKKDHQMSVEPASKPRSFDWLPCQVPDLSPPEGDGSQLYEDPKVLTLWGMDNNADPVQDAWEFNVNTLRWKKVPLPECAGEGRIWHTMASHHPTPNEAEIVVFGGTPQNMFSMDELHIHNVANTTILHCGVPSLYQLCLKLVAEDFQSFEYLFGKLPLHVQKVVKDEQLICSALNNYTSIRL